MINLIKSCSKVFYVKLIENKSYIFLLFDYLPFKELNHKKYAQIDAYYLKSNQSYLKTKKLIDKFKAKNIDAKFCNELNFKKELISLGGAVDCLNTLCVNEKFGSRFVIQVVEVNKEIKYDNDVFLKKVIKCKKCEVCCPNNAITSSGFIKEKCLRYMQENPQTINEKNCFLFSNKLLGCDVCQRCCPMNNFIKEREVPRKLKKLLSYNNLLKYFENSNKIKTDFKNIIGNNYARKKYFLKGILCCISNSQNKALLPELKKIECFVEQDMKEFYYYVYNKLKSL